MYLPITIAERDLSAIAWGAIAITVMARVTIPMIVRFMDWVLKSPDFVSFLRLKGYIAGGATSSLVLLPPYHLGICDTVFNISV